MPFLKIHPISSEKKTKNSNQGTKYPLEAQDKNKKEGKQGFKKKKQERNEKSGIW